MAQPAWHRDRCCFRDPDWHGRWRPCWRRYNPRVRIDFTVPRLAALPRRGTFVHVRPPLLPPPATGARAHAALVERVEEYVRLMLLGVLCIDVP